MSAHSWSFSGIKKFESCPRQFYHIKVLREYEEPPTPATLYGTEFHEAAEFYIRDNKPLPEKFAFAKAALDRLREFSGEKLCEFEMGLTENLEPCKFNDPNVWWRGIADLIILDHDTGVARVLDYKTGKNARYADKGQLELMALAVFKFFPLIDEVKSGLLFVVSNEFVKHTYTRDDESWLWKKWIGAHNRLKAAYDSNVWNPRPSGLCKKHCVVLSCAHNGRN
jgi:CRISPR/Cas system-associated exonuclease Cas4 (RecB family)